MTADETMRTANKKNFRLELRSRQRNSFPPQSGIGTFVERVGAAFPRSVTGKYAAKHQYQMGQRLSIHFTSDEKFFFVRLNFIALGMKFS